MKDISHLSDQIQSDSFQIDHALETCFTVSNGYFAIRGCYDELFEDEMSGCYVAGVFDKSEAQVRELCNLPNPFGLRLYIDRSFLDLRRCEILSHTRTLDMRNGLLHREYRVRDTQGRITRVKTTRFASVAHRHIGVTQMDVTAENYGGILNIESFILGHVTNNADSPNDRTRHYTAAPHLTRDAIACDAYTRDGDYHIRFASRLDAALAGKQAWFNRYARVYGEGAAQNCEVEISEGQTVRITRIVAVATNRSVEGDAPEHRALSYLDEACEQGADALEQAHTQQMRRLWSQCDIKIKGDETADRALRFNLYALLCSVNPEDYTVSIGAKGLHGEGYKGHVFWDTEIFILPFFIYTHPEIAKSLLHFRYHQLDAARQNARINGYRGAQYPWEAADTGLEETPKWGLDYKGNKVRIWTGDIEYHITCDIVYAIREYVRASNDLAFLADFGCEIVVETARFWASRLEENQAMGRYEIRGVIGPDEFHEHVDNNTYTNYLARFNMRYAAQCVEWIKSERPDDYTRLAQKLNLLPDEARQWLDQADKIYIPTSSDGKIFEQFEGYFTLEDPVITEFDENNMPLWPEGVDITKLGQYQLIKQADVVALLHLMGDEFDLDTKRQNYLYYEKRTMHKSSLSPSMYALLGVTVGQYEKAYDNFMRTVLVDLSDNQGNTAQGFHAASAGGAWLAVFFGFCGISVTREGLLSISPWLPHGWEGLTLPLAWQGRRLMLSITKEQAHLQLLEGEPGLKVILNGQQVVL